MKKIVLTLAAIIFTALAFGQNPTTTKEENLKGDVFFVRHTYYYYNENFGEPKEGGRIGRKDYYFDDHGRGIMFISIPDKQYYLVRYRQEGDNTIAGVLEFYPQWDEDGCAVLKGYRDHFFDNLVEITYNSDNLVIKQDRFRSDFPTEEYKLVGRITVKPVGNGMYECKMYGPSGNTVLDYKEQFDSNGNLTMLDNKTEYNNIRSGTYPFSIPHAGIYKYDVKGRLISYEQQKDSYPHKSEYVYNEHGDLKEVYGGTIQKGETRKLGLQITYEEYKYDDKGNWIYRIVSKDGKRTMIEKREIQYCNSKEEFESRMNALYSEFSVVDMKAAKEFAVFHEKYLERKRYRAEMPLNVYAPNASIEDADKYTVIVRVSFWDNYCKCNFKLFIFGQGVSEDIKEEYDYKYEDGKLIINNEVYEIDTLTGVLKNITRGFSFTADD